MLNEERPLVLVVGGGGREHAIAWALSHSASNPRIVAAPGNAGMSGVAECVPVAANDIVGLVKLAVEREAALVVIGPEEPLALGLADALRGAGLLVLGAGSVAAKLESSKLFAKDFMLRHHIPTARYRIVQSTGDLKLALAALGGRVVVKADGLAQGKGVFVCDSAEQAEHAARKLMVERVRGEAGSRLVLEERLEGVEATVMALCDGKTLLPLPVSRDHKRLLDGDKGPNTGGMGAVAPMDLPEGWAERIERDVLLPFLEGLRADRMDFRGVIYMGLMLTADGPKVLEYNVRFGDPETQAVLPVLKSDVYDLFLAAARGDLSGRHVEWDGRHACCVVLASGGYPDRSPEPKPISGPAAAPADVLVFHAGSELRPEGWFATGGRVLGVTGLGADLDAARHAAYGFASTLGFEGRQMRSDIGATLATPPTLAPAFHEPTPEAHSQTPAAFANAQSPKPRTRIWIFMGSESDLPVMNKATELLAEFGVDHKVVVASAHRSPDYLHRLLEEAERDTGVYIAGAGGAAHLAGVLASRTVKPVIGVPIGTKMGGLDSLLSTVQMPKGVPVATVAVDGAANAAILALEILALSDAVLRTRVQAWRKQQAETIEAKGQNPFPIGI